MSNKPNAGRDQIRQAMKGDRHDRYKQPPRQTFFKHDMPSRVDLAREKKAAVESAWREVSRAIDARDGRACRCCDRHSNPDATGLLDRGHRHHLVYRSAGGTDTTDNLVTLCAACHDAEHHNKLRIEGNPDVALLFFRKAEDGWFCCREESAVRQVRRD